MLKGARFGGHTDDLAATIAVFEGAKRLQGGLFVDGIHCCLPVSMFSFENCANDLVAETAERYTRR